MHTAKTRLSLRLAKEGALIPLAVGALMPKAEAFNSTYKSSRAGAITLRLESGPQSPRPDVLFQ
jgi:hypothetical protein